MNSCLCLIFFLFFANYSRRSFKCMEEFARRCLSSDAHYYDFIIRVLARNNVVLQLDLCTNAPYEKGWFQIA